MSALTGGAYPVFVRVDGNLVRVGTVARIADGFTLQMGELSVGTTPTAAPAAGGGAVFPNYGRAKGAPIAGAPRAELEYYANGARRSLADPEKARFHAKEQQLLNAIEAEMAKQGFTQEAPPSAEAEDGSIPF